MLPTHNVCLDSIQMAYPPTSSSHAAPSSLTNRRGESVTHKLLGPRGLAAFTVDTNPAPSIAQAQAQAAAAMDSGASPSAPDAPAKGRLPQKPRWRTWEFRFYMLVFAVVVPYMTWIPVKLSLCECMHV